MSSEHSTELQSSDFSSFCKILRSAKYPAILTGAGLSVASGIPTYVGADGLRTVSSHQGNSIEEWNKDPSSVWVKSHERREMCLKASPNIAHKLLASLSLPDIRRNLLPSLANPDHPPLYITQNIDGLCRRAIDEVLKDSSDLNEESKKLVHERHIEMHGSHYNVICTQCKCSTWTNETPLAPIFADDQYLKQDKILPIDQLPRCGGTSWSGSNRYGRCGGLLRPGIVWFGEIPHNQGEIVRNLTKVDVLLVIGTSSLVQPAASYAATVRKNGGTVALFNVSARQGADDANFVFLGPCEETIPKLFAALRNCSEL